MREKGDDSVNKTSGNKKLYSEFQNEDNLRDKSLIEDLHTILEGISDGFYVFDKDWRYIYINNAAEKQLGRKREELIGKIVWDVFPDYVGSREEVEFRKTVETEKTREFESYYQSTNQWFLFKCFPRNNNGLSVYIQDITTKKLTEESLRKSEDNFRTLADNISQFAWMADHTGHIFWYNKRWYDFTGTTLKDVEGWGWQKVHHPDYVEKVTKKFKDAVENKISWEDTFPLKGKDGNYRWFLSRAQPIKDSDGNVVRWFGTNTDITERKEIEKKLRFERSQLQAILDNAPVAISMKDVDSNMILANNYIYKAFEVPSPKDFIGKSIYEFFPMEIADELWSNDLKALNSDKPTISEEKIMNRDGKWHYYITAKFPVYYQGTKDLLGIGAISTDITELKETEEKLRESEEKFRLIVEGLPIFIWIAEPEGNVTYFSRLWKQYSDNLINEGHGWNWGPAIHPEDLQETIDAWTNSIKTGEDYNIVHRLKRNNGEYRWHYSQSSPMKDENGKILKWYGTSIDINERKQLEEKLEDTINNLVDKQIRFENAEKLAHAGSWYINDQSEIMHLSDEMRNLLSLPADKKTIKISEYLSLVHPDDMDLLNEAYRIYKEENIPIDIEYRILSNNKIKFIHSISHPIFDENGELQRRYGAALDITKYKDMEKVLSDERELFESIFNNIPVMLTIYDVNQKTFKFNKELIKILGYTEADTLDGSFMEKAYPDPEYRKAVAEYMKDSEIAWREFYVTAKDGTKVISAWSNISITSHYQVGIGIDLREIKKAEHALIESKRQLVEAQKLGRVGSYNMDFTKDPPKLVLSDELYNIFGIDSNKKDVKINDIFEQIHPDDQHIFKKRDLTSDTDNNVEELEYRILTKEGNVKYLYTRRITYFDKNNQLSSVQGTTIDITQRKLYEIELKQALENLKRSNEDLENFAHIASHDLQEPLRTISGFVKLLERKYRKKLDQDGLEYLEFIVEGASRMQNLIRGLLQYSRTTNISLYTEMVDLNKMMEAILQDLHISIDETNAEIIYSTLPTIKVDKVQIRQVFQNFITNAIKFRSVDSDPKIEIKAEFNKNEWLFSIKDNGIGLPEDSYEKIFMIFHRQDKNKYPGYGIGLSICKRIINNYKGKIWVESEIGKGTTFYFTIPINR